MIHLCLRKRRNGGPLNIHGVHQVGGVVDMHRREGGRKEDMADFVCRAEIRARFGDNACRAIGGMSAAAVQCLLKSIHKKNADTPSRNDTAQSFDIQEFSGGIPFALPVDLFEAIRIFLRQSETQSGAEINPNAELRIHGLGAGKNAVERHLRECEASEMQANSVGKRIPRSGHTEGGTGARPDDAVWHKAGLSLKSDHGGASAWPEDAVHRKIGAGK